MPPTKVIQEDLDLRFKALPLYDPLQKFPLGSMPFDVTLTGFSVKNPPFAPLAELHPTLENHNIPGFVVDWNTKKAKPLIRINCNSLILSSHPVALEFSAILIGGSTLNSSTVPATISVRLQSGGTSSLQVKAIIERSVALEGTIKGNGENITRSILSTIRIPLSKFGPLSTSFLAKADLLLDLADTKQLGQMAITDFRASFQAE